MRRFTAAKLLTLAVVSAALAACGGSTNMLSSPVSAATAYLLTSNNRIIGVDLDDLEFARSVRSVAQAITTTPVAGELDMGEVILDIDYRNSEGALYALTRGGSSITTTTGRIVRIDPTNGSVSRASTLVADTTDTTAAYTGLDTTKTYTIDFDPTIDRLRIIGSDGSNLRVDTLTGETITDNNVSSGNTLSGTAYRDDFSPAGTGRVAPLFNIDIGSTSVPAQVLSMEPTSGVLSAGKDLGIGTISAIGGYDINPITNVGFAVLTTSGIQRVYTINPTNTGSAATIQGVLPKLDGGETYKGLALVTVSNPTVTALDKTNNLYTFRARTPGEVSAATRVNFSPSDTLIGIDFRQSDRVLYGLARSGKIYNLNNPTNPVARPKVASLTSTVAYTLDFNPLVATGATESLMRLIGSDKSNISINIDNSASDTASAPVSGNTEPTVVAAAHLNNFRNATNTSLLVIDRNSSSLNVQSTASGSEGALTRLSALGITLDPNSPVGFDISGRGNDNQLLMARTASTTSPNTPNTGPFTLYRVSLSAIINPLTAVGSIANSNSFIDIAIQF